jgi:hypothetical protein
MIKVKKREIGQRKEQRGKGERGGGEKERIIREE